MTTITDLSQLDPNGHYSYADYLNWRFDAAIELIRGKISLMSPAPSLDHQRVSWQLTGYLFEYFRKKPCRAFAAPFDVRLYDRRKSVVANQDIYTVVQPDLCVICDTAKLDPHGCLGAPDWIIEILSKGNSKKEMQTKFELYRESGVKEYWIVYPFEQAVHQFVLDEEYDIYRLLNMFSGEDLATPNLFSDCTIDLQEVFAE
ncbi:MAG: Uma2 family endonuclease [Methylomonas sp.]|nr:Uma2 family endonuclease [Methylomonas sp.]PPD21727.1 MAG: restriction endonuclease [Methylomonas sp.]PPD25962.1 MAG: restriction endonuclease [Methylomonas sp.]PPD37699.1 MAG: restriction endonuclease [Methylomonas sp.]PPD39309.1 MAG: restriction endonuclease [Methylomonas sp.]